MKGSKDFRFILYFIFGFLFLIVTYRQYYILHQHQLFLEHKSFNEPFDPEQIAKDIKNGAAPIWPKNKPEYNSDYSFPLILLDYLPFLFCLYISFFCLWKIFIIDLSFPLFNKDNSLLIFHRLNPLALILFIMFLGLLFMFFIQFF